MKSGMVVGWMFPSVRLPLSVFKGSATLRGIFIIIFMHFRSSPPSVFSNVPLRNVWKQQIATLRWIFIIYNYFHAFLFFSPSVFSVFKRSAEKKPHFEMKPIAHQTNEKQTHSQILVERWCFIDFGKTNALVTHMHNTVAESLIAYRHSIVECSMLGYVVWGVMVNV